MQITVTTQEGGVFPLHVNDELLLSNLKVLLEVEVGIATNEMLIVHNMSPLRQDDMMLKDCGIQNKDILLLVKVNAGEGQDCPSVSSANSQPQPGGTQLPTHPGEIQLPNIDWGSIRVPPASLPSRGSAALQTSSDPQPPSVESIVQYFLSNPEEFAALQQRNPEMAEALMSGDKNLILHALSQYRQQIIEEERQRAELAGLDPWSEEYQQKLAENIRRRNIEENMATALEHNPEIFVGHVHMLYVSCKVNGKVVKALVDTGAQMTVMNVQCAHRCDIMRLLDRRYASYAFGIGRQKILGIIHLGQIQIGDDFIVSSFRVLENQSQEMILGLDMLKRYQCCIDLSRDVLIIGTTGKEVKFLSESEIPKSTYEIEEKGALEDEDHEMASAIAQSEEEFKHKNKSNPDGSAPPQEPPPPPSVTEESIQSVMAAGFTRETAIEELVNCNGDPDAAKASLFAKLF